MNEILREYEDALTNTFKQEENENYIVANADITRIKELIREQLELADKYQIYLAPSLLTRGNYGIIERNNTISVLIYNLEKRYLQLGLNWNCEPQTINGLTIPNTINDINSLISENLDTDYFAPSRIYMSPDNKDRFTWLRKPENTYNHEIIKIPNFEERTLQLYVDYMEDPEEFEENKKQYREKAIAIETAQANIIIPNKITPPTDNEYYQSYYQDFKGDLTEGELPDLNQIIKVYYNDEKVTLLTYIVFRDGGTTTFKGILPDNQTTISIHCPAPGKVYEKGYLAEIKTRPIADFDNTKTTYISW